MKAAMQNLLSLPLFKGLASDELDTILGIVNALVKHFEKSDYIYFAGDAVESIGIVVIMDLSPIISSLIICTVPATTMPILSTASPAK